jgi:hypothetical protein
MGAQIIVKEAIPARRVFIQVDFRISVPSTERRLAAREGKPPLIILLLFDSHPKAEVAKLEKKTGLWSRS